jgi:hypothetical protein
MPQIPNPKAVGDMERASNLPEGTYHVRVEKVEYVSQAAKVDKHPYLNLQLSVVQPEEFTGRKIWTIVTLKPGADFALRALLEAAGFGEADVFSDTDELVDREVSVAVIIEAGQQGYGPRNKVTKFMSVV